MAFMKIGCLEMEKARREKERYSAATRISNIDARLSEIEAEKGELLSRLGERSARKASGKPDVVTEANRREAKGTRAGFKIRY